MGELDLFLKRDQYRREVIVERKQKKVLCFKVKDETSTTIIETRKINTADLKIQNLPVMYMFTSALMTNTCVIIHT